MHDGEADFQGLIDWHGCEAVQFDPEELGGRATVGATRMDADGVLINYESGMTVDEIVSSFGVDKDAVEKILAFGVPRRLQALSRFGLRLIVPYQGLSCSCPIAAIV